MAGGDGDALGVQLGSVGGWSGGLRDVGGVGWVLSEMGQGNRRMESPGAIWQRPFGVGFYNRAAAGFLNHCAADGGSFLSLIFVPVHYQARFSNGVSRDLPCDGVFRDGDTFWFQPL